MCSRGICRSNRCVLPKPVSSPRADADGDFLAFCGLGRALAKLQTRYEKVEPYELERIFTKEPFIWRIEAMMLSKDRTRLIVNACLTLAGIPPEAFDHRLGDRSALEWIVDQYRVRMDRRSGITLDPNRSDDERYIVRLVGQVVRVSLQTNRLMGLIGSVALPEPDQG